MSNNEALNLGVDRENPWPGLNSFTEDQRLFFHGRNDEAEDLLRRVDRKNLTVLFGQSGLGKSSLLQAGLFPRLRSAGYLPVPIRLDYGATSRSLASQTLGALRQPFLDAGVVNFPADSDTDLVGGFALQIAGIEYSRRATSSRGHRFDQFEEMFSLGQANANARVKAAAFLTELADFIENRAPVEFERLLDNSPELGRTFDFEDRGFRTLICLREDYLPHLEGTRKIMPSIVENRLRLTRMNGDDALDAILKPGGNLIDANVAKQIVRFVAGKPIKGTDDALEWRSLEVEPSLLSLVCRELNNRRLADKSHQITADLLAGNRERILEDFYERCFVDLPAEARTFVENELVTDSGLRENMAVERARKSLASLGANDAALDTLVKRRLLHLEDRLDVRRIELTHDVLTSVVVKSRDARHARELAERTRREADASRRIAIRQRRRTRMIVLVMGTALAIMSTFGVFSYSQWREAVRQKEEARQAREDAERERDLARKSEALAETRFGERRDSMDAMLAQLNDEQLKTMPGTQEIRKRLFEKGIELYERLSSERPDDPELRFNVAERYGELAQLASELSNFEEAIEKFQKSIGLADKLGRDFPENAKYRRLRAITNYRAGYACWSQARRKEAWPFLETAIEECTALLAQLPEDVEAKFHLHLAQYRIAQCDLPDAQRMSSLEEDALNGLTELVAQRPDDSRMAVALARIYVNPTGDLDKKEKSFETARALCQRAIALAPNNQDAITFLALSTTSLAKVMGQTGRVKEGITLTEPTLDTLRERVRRNPSVSMYAKSLSFALEDSWRLYLRANQPDVAIAMLREIILVTENAAERDPGNAEFLIFWIDAQNSLAEYYKSIQRNREAVEAWDAVITAGPEMMARLPTSVGVLQRILHAHRWRGDEARLVRQFSTAINAFDRGVSLYQRFRDGCLGDGETCDYNYLSCSDGLLRCAKDEKDVKRALDIGKRLILLIPFETFKESDFRSTHFDAYASLSTLNDEAGDPEEALHLRRILVTEATKALGGDPKSNWYVGKHIWESHQHLAQLYRKTNDEEGEYASLRDYFRETVPYVSGKDNSDLLKETESFSILNLQRLRGEFETASLGGLKRFTISYDFDGIKYPFHVYVAQTWPYLEDQFKWVEKVRGGKVPDDVRTSFKKLYDIAKENNVSYTDLCMYALGTGANQASKTDGNAIVGVDATNMETALEELAAARRALEQKGGKEDRKKLAFKYIRLAEADVSGGNPGRAINLLEDGGKYLELDSLGRNQDAFFADAASYYRYVLAAATGSVGNLDVAYELSTECITTQISTPDPLYAIPRGAPEFVLGWISAKRNRQNEAIAWYQRAAELGHPFAPQRIYGIAESNPIARMMLPPEVQERIEKAKSTKSDKESAQEIFAKLTVDFKESRSQTSGGSSSRILDAKVRNLARDFSVVADVFGEANSLVKRQDALRKAYELAESISDKALLGEFARKLGISFNDDTEAAMWLEKGVGWGDPDSAIALADRYDDGSYKSIGKAKAESLRFKGLVMRGFAAFQNQNYVEAEKDLVAASKMTLANGRLLNGLGNCLGKQEKWVEALDAYTRALNISSIKSDEIYDTWLNFMEACVIAEKPDVLKTVAKSLADRGWRPAKQDTPENKRFWILYHGMRAMLQISSGMDATKETNQLSAALAGREHESDRLVVP